jgi:energy-coupling factor transporter ATP-binding protein EcfA2
MDVRAPERTREYRNHHLDSTRWDHYRVREGDIVVILGANGAGKSSLLKAVAGLQAPGTGAHVALGGRELVGLPAHQIVEAGLALVPEGRGIFGELTGRRVVLVGAGEMSEGAAKALAQQGTVLSVVNGAGNGLIGRICAAILLRGRLSTVATMWRIIPSGTRNRTNASPLRIVAITSFATMSLLSNPGSGSCAAAASVTGTKIFSTGCWIAGSRWSLPLGSRVGAGC